MKKGRLFTALAIAGFLAVLLIYVNWNEIMLSYYLSQDYPEFLQPMPAETIDRRIDSFQALELQQKDLEALWRLLWMKKEFYRNRYITIQERERFIKRISAVKVDSLQGTYLQFNLLKYKLGVNDIVQLEQFDPTSSELVRENTCKKIDSVKPEVDWEDSCPVSHFAEAKFFCGMALNQSDKDSAQRVISQNLGSCVVHCQEHCFEDVTVYVNDCSMAKNDNERYHCLFFLDSGQ